MDEIRKLLDRRLRPLTLRSETKLLAMRSEQPLRNHLLALLENGTKRLESELGKLITPPPCAPVLPKMEEPVSFKKKGLIDRARLAVEAKARAKAAKKK